MARLDEIVNGNPERWRYPVAKALYEASFRGLLNAQIPPTTMYGWVFKWATLPEARGSR